GYIPNWLRQALVQRLDKERLVEILRLIEGFLQPVENQRIGAVSLEIARRSDGKFRQFLLHWIKQDTTGELDDHILVDALRGRDPKQLGVPVPMALGSRLRGLFRATEWSAIALAIIAAALLWIFHTPIIDALGSLWGQSGGRQLTALVNSI